MERRKSLWWIFWVLLATLSIISLIILGYEFSWTGFSSTKFPKNDNYEFVPGKTLWDWLNLLVIPAVLAVIAYLFNRSEKKVEREKTLDQQRETALQTYFNYMTELLLDKGLSQESVRDNDAAKSPSTLTMRSIARARTLTVLRSLDGERKRQVIQFLMEAKLIEKSKIVDISGADLSNALLIDLNFQGLWLENIDLRGADFSRSILKDMHILGSTKIDSKWKKILDIVNYRGSALEENFVNNDLTNANFEKVDFGKSDLRGADMSGALLKNAKFQNAQLDKKTKIPNKYFEAWKIFSESRSSLNEKSINLSGKDFSEVNFESIKLINPNFQSSKLTGTIFSNSSLMGSNFNGADLFGAVFSKANLRNSDFSKSNLSFTDFSGADLRESVFENNITCLVEFEKADLTKSNFINADLAQNNMQYAKLVGADLTSANLRGANLSKADLSNAVLLNADLTGVDLCGANLENADLTNCNLEKIKTDSNTIIDSKWLY